MLPRDKGGVVDPKLKVYGTKNLRVVDLSIVPLLVAAHTQGLYCTVQHGEQLLMHFTALVYGIAEQGMFIS